LLRVAFDRHALDVAGPAVPFDPAAAVEAAVVLASACWSLVSEEPVRLKLRCEPSSPSAHLSGDVTLRLLPAVYRRAKLRAEPLAAELDALLRRWPLSGVLADLDGEPTTPPDFGGHPGIQLLYAERPAGTGRPGCVPADGPAREWVERVFAERCKPVSAPVSEEDARA
jgi:hypothetical protein